MLDNEKWLKANAGHNPEAAKELMEKFEKFLETQIEETRDPDEKEMLTQMQRDMEYAEKGHAPARGLSFALMKYLKDFGWTMEDLVRNCHNPHVTREILENQQGAHAVSRIGIGIIAWRIFQSYLEKDKKSEIDIRQMSIQLDDILSDLYIAEGYTTPHYSAGLTEDAAMDVIQHRNVIRFGYLEWEGVVQDDIEPERIGGVVYDTIYQLSQLLESKMNLVKYDSVHTIEQALVKGDIQIGAPFPYPASIRAERTCRLDFSEMNEAVRLYHHRMSATSSQTPLPAVMIVKPLEPKLLHMLNFSMNTLNEWMDEAID